MVSTARTAAFSRFVTILERSNRERPNLLRVLTYHRIDYLDSDSKLDPGLISATPGVFDQQMSYLAIHYHVVSAQELIDACRTHSSLPPRSVMVTFDDAYQDFAQHAWPILKRYQLPATLFVPTAFPDDSKRAFWWDRLYQALSTTTRQDTLDTLGGRLPLRTAAQRRQALVELKKRLKRLPHLNAMDWVDQICFELDAPRVENNVLSWDTLKRLAREGVALGAHSRTHPQMTRIPPEEMQAEAIGSLCDLEHKVGTIPETFAYPHGACNDQVVRVLKHAGFRLAFTTGRGINDLQHPDPFRLRRINVGRHATLTMLRAQLLPWSRYLNRLQRVSAS